MSSSSEKNITLESLHGAGPQLPAPPAPFDLIRNGAAAKTVIAFDFDGTLVSIAPRPELVELPADTRERLARAAQRFHVLICSGRSVANLEEWGLVAPGLDLIGNHGAEWRISGSHPRDLTPSSWIHWREKACQDLLRQTARHGGWLEDKGRSFTVHFRQSGKEWWTSQEARDWLAGWVDDTARVMEGSENWNIIPVGVSKGESLLRYCQEYTFQRLIYFGDEITDETVFERAGRVPGLEIIGIRVGSGETAARYRVPDPSAVRAWLAALADFREPPRNRSQLSMLDKGLT